MRRRSIVKRCAVGLFLLLQPYFITAQEVKKEAGSDLIETLKEYFSDNSGSDDPMEESLWERCIEHLEFFINHPIPINTAGRNQLGRLGLLSDFQIESILNYRENSGYILGAAELSMIHGFDNDFTTMLLPFITFEFDPNALRQYGNRVPLASGVYLKTSLQSKRDSTWLTSSAYMQAKYKLICGNLKNINSIEAGFTIENDAGEPFFTQGRPAIDFTSFHLAINNFHNLNTLIIGDFSARFGQGLTIWNGFSIHGSGNPMMLYKRGNKLQPYTSSDENNFYRGIAASFTFGKVDFSAMLSYNRLDAVLSDGKYTSLPTGGVHNTAATLSARKKMGETVAGINLSLLTPSIKLELSAISYKYDKQNGRKMKDYNKYQIYNGIWGNFALSFYSVINRWKIFGEMALDYGANGAMLAGACFPLSQNSEAGILFRHYSKKYIAPHALAYSTTSSISNQSGITLHYICTLNNKLKLYSETDITYYPWKRYNIDHSSFMAKTGIKLGYTSPKLQWSTKVSEKYTSHNRIHKLYGKATAQYQISPPFSAKGVLACSMCISGLENTSAGWMIGTNFKYTLHPRSKITLQAGGCYFNCPEWNCRLYQYEPDLPYTYSNRLLYGEGGSFYLLAKINPIKGLELYAKGDTVQYITKNKEAQSRLKLAARYSF